MSNFKKGILYQVPDFKKDAERQILTQNSKFDPLRVKISNESQLILDFQGKISRNTCQTQDFVSTSGFQESSSRIKGQF